MKQILDWVRAHRKAFAVILAALLIIELVRRMVNDNLTAALINMSVAVGTTFFKSSPKQ